jgi:hypothetical protein
MLRLSLLVFDITLAVLGVVMLLFAYRMIGKPPGVDERYDAAMVHQAVIYKATGWCAIGMAVLGMVAYLTDSLW